MKYLNVEFSWRGEWFTVEYPEAGYRVHADSFAQRATEWRRSTATSPIMDGDVLVHATKGMVAHQIGVYVSGEDQSELTERILALEEVLSQFSFRMRFTKDSIRETHLCQLPTNFSVEGGHVLMHNNMAIVRATIPAYPDPTTERLDA